MALSGGQKQRVAIATALVSDRKILVLDEPTSGLDLQHMKEVADELVTIQKMGKTSLVITHDYELIVSCCTHRKESFQVCDCSFCQNFYLFASRNPHFHFVNLDPA